MAGAFAERIPGRKQRRLNFVLAAHMSFTSSGCYHWLSHHKWPTDAAIASSYYGYNIYVQRVVYPLIHLVIDLFFPSLWFKVTTPFPTRSSRRWQWHRPSCQILRGYLKRLIVCFLNALPSRGLSILTCPGTWLAIRYKVVERIANVCFYEPVTWSTRSVLLQIPDMRWPKLANFPSSSIHEFKCISFFSLVC